MTYADIESDVRTLLQDTKPTYRFAPVEVYGYIPPAFRALVAVRPSALFVDGHMPTTAAAMEPPTAAAALAASGAVNVPAGSGDRYRLALTYYVASKCLERDDGDTQNLALAATYMQNFASAATS
jgi:hypothetical protein